MILQKSALILVTLTVISVHQVTSQDFSDFIAVKADIIALENAKTIDGTGGAPQANQTIIIQGDRIISVGSEKWAQPTFLLYTPLCIWNMGLGKPSKSAYLWVAVRRVATAYEK